MTTDLNKRSLRTRRKKTMNSFYYNNDYSNDLNSEDTKSKINLVKKNDTLLGKTKDHSKRYSDIYDNKNPELSGNSIMSDANVSDNNNGMLDEKKTEFSEEMNVNNISDEESLAKMRNNNKIDDDMINIKSEYKLDNPSKIDKNKNYTIGNNISNKNGCNKGIKNVSNSNENNYAKMAEKLPHVVGVRFDKSQNRWLSGICINGRCINRYFPVYKYGFEEARRLAIQHRKNFETANAGNPKKQQGESKTSHLNLLNINSKIPNGFKDIHGKNKLIFKYLSYDSIQKEWVVTYDYDSKVLVNKFPVDIYGYNNAYEMAVQCINKLTICNQNKMNKNLKNDNGKNIKYDFKSTNSQSDLNDDDDDASFTLRKDKLNKFIKANNDNNLYNKLNLEDKDGISNRISSNLNNGHPHNINEYDIEKNHNKMGFDMSNFNQTEKMLNNPNFYKYDTSALGNKKNNSSDTDNDENSGNNNDDNNLLQIYNEAYLNDDDKNTYNILNNIVRRNNSKNKQLGNRTFDNQTDEDGNIISSNDPNKISAGIDGLTHDQLSNENLENLNNSEHFKHYNDDLNSLLESNKMDNKFEDGKDADSVLNEKKTPENISYDSIFSFNRIIKNILKGNKNESPNEQITKGINIIKSMKKNDKLKVHKSTEDYASSNNGDIDDAPEENGDEHYNFSNGNISGVKRGRNTNKIRHRTKRKNKNNNNNNKYFIVKNDEDVNEENDISIAKSVVNNLNEKKANAPIDGTELEADSKNAEVPSQTEENFVQTGENTTQVGEQNEEIEKTEAVDPNMNNESNENTKQNTPTLNDMSGENANITNNSDFNEVALKLSPWKKGIEWNQTKNKWTCQLWDNDGNAITKHIYIKNKEGIEIAYNYCVQIRLQSFDYYLINVLNKFPKIDEISYTLENPCFILSYKDNEKKKYYFQEEGIYNSFISCVEYLNQLKSENEETLYNIDSFIEEHKDNIASENEINDENNNNDEDKKSSTLRELEDLMKDMNYFEHKKTIFDNMCEESKTAYSIKPWLKGVVWEEKVKKWIVFFKDKNQNLRISFFNPCDYNNDVIMSYNKCCEYFNQIKESNNFDENTEEFSESIRQFIKSIEFDKVIDYSKNNYSHIDKNGSASSASSNISNDSSKNIYKRKKKKKINSYNEDSHDLADASQYRKNNNQLGNTKYRISINNIDKNLYNSYEPSNDEMGMLDYNSPADYKYFNGNDFYNNSINGKSKHEKSSRRSQKNKLKKNMLDDIDIESANNDEMKKKYLNFDDNNSNMNNDYSIGDRSFKMDYSEFENNTKENPMNEYGDSNAYFRDDLLSPSSSRTIARDIPFDSNNGNHRIGSNNYNMLGINTIDCNSSDIINGSSSERCPNEMNMIKDGGSDISGATPYGKGSRISDKYSNIDNKSINKSTEKLDNLLDGGPNVRLPKSEILNQAASLPKLQGMFFDKRRNYWTVSVCGFRKSFGVRTRGVYQAYKLAAEFRNRILETNKGKCYPQKSPAVANSYKYNLKNVNGLTKEEKTNFLRDSESLQASSGVENSYNNKRTSLTIMNNTDKDLLYTPSDRRSNFKDTDGSVINENNNNDTSNIYEYLLENKMNSNILNNNNLLKATYLPSSAANSVSHDENYSDMVYDERINFTGKSKKKLDKKYKSNNNMDPNYMNYMNDGTYDMREDKNNNSLFKKSGNNQNNGSDNNNVSPSNTAISNLGSGPNYSPTNMYEIDNTHNTLDYYIKSENAANGLGKLEDLKNMKNNNYNQTSSFLKGDIRNGEGINENNMYSKNLNNADYEDTQNLMNNKMNSHNLEDKLNRPYSNNMLYNNSENNNYENTNIHINGNINSKDDLYKNYNLDGENKMFNLNTIIDETIEERDIRINKEVNKCKFVDGLIYDEANKCFRIKINGYRKAYSVIRRGVKEAYKLSIEAIQQIKKQSKANNYNNSEQPQINSNNLTHFYNSSSETSKHGYAYNYQYIKNKQGAQQECGEDIFENYADQRNANKNSNAYMDATGRRNFSSDKKNKDEASFPILNIDDSYYELLKTAIIICLNDILMNSIPKIFHLYKNLSITEDVKIEDILNVERKKKEQSLKYHIEYTQNSIGVSSLIPYLKLFSTEILNNILPSAQSLEIQRLIIHSLDLQAYNTSC
ncbi:hypothetical protein YYG_02014 [Plasmodium vinckei petteri]|uniref:Transcription factor with AP2 domain(S), putative n=1 Tax=Plasmodium vinckei petteri TaxID=138298 RepID=W7AWQ7_PLAVN|nr:hypothetical protein YYG_02014 [Plasmodium vinckei petteri]CAD2104914.1 transcription factor with AP2 domain(s), putative [Plasmodium vinckei petteri]